MSDIKRQKSITFHYAFLHNASYKNKLWITKQSELIKHIVLSLSLSLALSLSLCLCPSNSFSLILLFFH